ncbi:hypothetical protein MTP99_015307 [Tenebrio molitor]|nr:hypothetical protein MTP99_015307 [Tenebrio molitor]
MQRSENIQTKRKVHPKDKANFLSQFLFCWQLLIVVKNYKNDFTEEELYPNLAEHSSEKLGNELEAKWQEEESSRKRPALFRALFRMFGLRFIFYGVALLVLEFAATFLRPLCLQQFLEFYSPQQKNSTKQQACLFGLAIISLNLLRVLYYHQFNLEFSSLGTKVRVACSSLMYRKYLRLKRETCQKFTLGQMVNLLSNDIDRFQDVFGFLHHVWISPLKLLVGFYYFNVILGKTAMAGFLIYVIFFILQIFTMGRLTSHRVDVAQKTDHRIRLMDDIICGIQIIKMYTWEKPFAKLVDLSRK